MSNISWLSPIDEEHLTAGTKMYYQPLQPAAAQSGGHPKIGDTGKGVTLHSRSCDADG